MGDAVVADWPWLLAVTVLMVMFYRAVIEEDRLRKELELRENFVKALKAGWVPFEQQSDGTWVWARLQLSDEQAVPPMPAD